MGDGIELMVVKCNSCTKKGTMLCPNSALCLSTTDYPHYEEKKESKNLWEWFRVKAGGNKLFQERE